MGKFSPRTLLWGIFCVWVTVFLSGCVQSLGLDSFVNDDEVQGIIEKSAGTVFIKDGSVSGLVGSNKKISGLSLDKYYMVETWDDQGDFVNVRFLTANGKLSEKLTDIAKATVREIGELTNNYHYRVKTTMALPRDVPYTALNPPDSAQVATNTGGMIKLPGPEDNGFIIYTLTPPLLLPLEGIVEIPFTPAGDPPAAASSARFSQDGEIITLIGRETVTDFIFYGYIPDAVINFFILRVASDKVEDPEMPGEGGTGSLKVTVNFTMSAGDKTFELDPDDPALITFSQADLLDDKADKKISITLQYDGIFDPDSIKWTYNAGQPDEITWDGAAMTIDFDDDEDAYIALLAIGKYTISVEATALGVVYGSSFELEITK